MKYLQKISIILVIFYSQNIISQEKYWENLSLAEQNQILNDSITNKSAVDYYSGNFKLTDDTLTFDLLRTLVFDQRQSTLYFYLFNTILKKADGALAEVLGSFCFAIFMYNTEYTIKYFISFPCKELVCLYDLYSLQIASAFYYNEAFYIDYRLEFIDFKKKILYRFSAKSIDEKIMAETIIQKIEDRLKEITR